MLSPILIWLLPAAPEASKVRFWPFTVMVSPATNAVDKESLTFEDAPESNVALVIGGVAAAVRVTLVWPVRPSLASVPADEPARLMSLVRLVVRLILPLTSTVAVPPVAASTAFR